jgi:hypothetical protein
MDGTTSNIEQYPTIILEGRNLSKKETRYYGDLHHLRKDIYEPSSENLGVFYKINPEISTRLTHLESVFEVAKKSNTPIKQLKIDQNEKVILNRGQIFHKVPTPLGDNFESPIIHSIAKHGIIASEWFGILELWEEGRFCSFFDTISETKRIINTDEFLFTIDQDNPDLQNLLHLDFFSYLRMKTQNPSAVSSTYTPEELKILVLIEKWSMNGESIASDMPSWMAIPGGIPPRFINGICVDGQLPSSTNEPGTHFDERTQHHYKNPTNETVETLSILFPNATIFNRNQDILFRPEVK